MSKNNSLKNLFFITLVLLVSLLVSCEKQEQEISVASQEKSIESFVTAQTNSRIAFNGGVNRVVLQEGSGDTLASGDSLILEYAAYIFSSGKGPVFATNIPQIAVLAGIDISNTGMQNYGIQLGKTPLLSGVGLGLRGVRKGEHSYIVFSSRFGYGNKIVGIVPKYSPLIFEVWIKEVKKN
jgi:hypothetical protein